MMKTPAINVGKKRCYLTVNKFLTLQVGLNWSTWFEGTGATANAARLDCMANILAKAKSDRYVERAQAAIQAALDKEREGR